MKTWAAMLVGAGWLGVAALASCGGDDSNGAGDDGGPDHFDGAPSDGPGGGPSDGSGGDSTVAKPGRFLFAKTLPAAAGPIAALPGGGWVVFVEILHSATIAGTVINRSGRDDAALVKLDAKGDPVWAKPIQGPGDDNRASLAVDESGNIYVAGLSIMGTSMDFGDGITASTPSASNAQWGWFAKFDSNGTAQWARSVGADLGLFSVHVAARNGKVAVSGYYSEPNFKYFGTSGVVAAPAFGNYPTFILSCGATDGLATSMARLDGAEVEMGIALNTNGQATVVGSFVNPKLTKEPTGDVLSRFGVGSNAFAVTIDASGAPVWARGIGSNAVDAAAGGVGVSDVVMDGNGHLVLGGSFGGGVDFGGGVRNAVGNGDPFVLSLDPTTGSTTWDKPIASTADYVYTLVALGSAGKIATAGNFVNAPTATSIDGIPLPTTAGPYIGKLDPAPTLAWLWHAAVTPPASAFLSGVATNDAGDVAVTGGVKGTIDLGGGPIYESDSGFEDMFVLGVADP